MIVVLVVTVSGNADGWRVRVIVRDRDRIIFNLDMGFGGTDSDFFEVSDVGYGKNYQGAYVSHSYGCH